MSKIPTMKSLLEHKGYDVSTAWDIRIIPPISLDDEAIVRVIIKRMKGDPGQEVRLRLS